MDQQYNLPALMPTSGVPQNVDVVPEGSIPSLQSPKSVKTIWPYEQNSKQHVTLGI